MKKRSGLKAVFFICIVTVALMLPGAALADFSGTWFVNSIGTVMGCGYSGSIDVSQNGLALTGTLDLSFTGTNCPTPVSVPLSCTAAGMAFPLSFTCDDYNGSPISVHDIAGLITSQTHANGSVNVIFATGAPVPSDWTATRFANPVPAMTKWGIIIFVVLAGLGAMYYIRRQKRANN
jgi:hypothetical protein